MNEMANVKESVSNGYSLPWSFHMFASLQLKHDIGGAGDIAHGCGSSYMNLWLQVCFVLIQKFTRRANCSFG